MRRVECPAPLWVGIIDKRNFEVVTVHEGEIVQLAVIVDDIGYQVEGGHVIPFEWHGATDRLCQAAIRVYLRVDA